MNRVGRLRGIWNGQEEEWENLCGSFDLYSFIVGMQQKKYGRK